MIAGYVEEEQNERVLFSFLQSVKNRIVQPCLQGRDIVGPVIWPTIQPWL